MVRAGSIVVILLLAVFNAVYSPYSFMVFALQGIWYPAIWPAPFTQMLILSGVISGVLHLLVTGVPAALFEKFISTNQTQSNVLWLSTMLLPSYQTLRHIGWL